MPPFVVVSILQKSWKLSGPFACFNVPMNELRTVLSVGLVGSVEGVGLNREGSSHIKDQPITRQLILSSVGVSSE